MPLKASLASTRNAKTFNCFCKYMIVVPHTRAPPVQLIECQINGCGHEQTIQATIHLHDITLIKIYLLLCQIKDKEIQQKI